MATRLLKRHDEQTRAKIQASQIINRLTGHVLGEVEMSATQVRAAEVLLKKTLPDVQSIQISGDEDNPLRSVNEIRVTFVDSESDDT